MSWSDVLLGSLPNIYVYACNNPSETIVAKRRGYATIVSHNVPPYGRYTPPLHMPSPVLQLPVTLLERRKIQRNKGMTDRGMSHGNPPNDHVLGLPSRI